MRDEDIKYINELEERLQELESELNKQIEIGYKFEGEVYDLEKQNKRYREAIEVAIRNMAASDNLGVKFALGILEQALEGEE